MEEFGRMAARLRPRLPGIPWPQRKELTDAEAGYFQELIGAERSFLKSRRDLIEVLAAESEVVRGDIYAWQGRASHVRDVFKS